MGQTTNATPTIRLALTKGDASKLNETLVAYRDQITATTDPLAMAHRDFLTQIVDQLQATMKTAAAVEAAKPGAQARVDKFNDAAVPKTAS